MKPSYSLAAAVLALGLAPAAQAADPVNIAPDLPSATVETPEGPAVIARNPDPDAALTGEWARTSRACPPFCIQPMSPAEGVTTIGELELIEKLRDPEVLVLDSRTYDWFAAGTIPGAMHMPYNEVVDRLEELGCEADFDGWNCENAKEVALFCNGAWCGQSPTAIRAMLAEGYPADRISYYRGGMQGWRLLGLSVTEPAS
jgi:rhodanese-related sulfurtransferase